MKRIFFVVIVLACFKNIFSQSSYENLVFEGAGIRGIAYGGVLQELEKNKILNNIERVGGTSAGAITALMVSLGYTSTEITAIISDTKFQKFNDGKFIFIGGLVRMNKNYGWYRSKAFNNWLEKMIKQKTGNADITFSELVNKGYKELYITATCVNKQKLVVFSHHSYPNMKIKDAVRASMSVPLYFEAIFMNNEGEIVKHDKHNEAIDIMIDGGIIGNYPIFMFDSIDATTHKRIPNMKTLGIKIDSDEQIQLDATTHQLATIPIKNVIDYCSALYAFSLENLNRNNSIPEDITRSILVSNKGIGPRVKRLSIKQKSMLVESGVRSTKTFLKRS